MAQLDQPGDDVADYAMGVLRALKVQCGQQNPPWEQLAPISSKTLKAYVDLFNN